MQEELIFSEDQEQRIRHPNHIPSLIFKRQYYLPLKQRASFSTSSS